jgi:hypothetical protein
LNDAGPPPSSRNLGALPEIEALRRRFQQFAALGAAMSPHGLGSFEYHPDWAASEEMGAYKNGSGDEGFAHFTSAGCCLIGFAHESTMSPYRVEPPALWPGLTEDVPSEFQSSLAEPAFGPDDTTFVIWRRSAEPVWRTGAIHFPNDYGDGSADLLWFVDLDAEAVAAWLEEEYEADVDAAIVADVLSHRPLDASRLRRLNPNAPVAELSAAVAGTGYPTAEPTRNTTGDERSSLTEP